MISIVVPVYNVEKYLERCVKSIAAQTYKDIEIILVDDGSNDKSGLMCDEFALENEKITALHKENGGLSDARNYGMEHSNGEYICFIDSDDYIEPNMMEVLISTIGDADMATCGVYNDYVSGIIPQYANTDISFETDNVEAFKMILEGKLIPATICNKLIKTHIAKMQKFPVGRLYEDAFYTNELISHINRVRVNTIPLYHYVHRQGSITTSPFKEKDMDIIAAYENTQKLISKFPGIEQYARFRILWAYFTVLDRMLMLDDYKNIPAYKEVLGFLKKHAFEVIKNRIFTKSRRISALALKINVRLYRILLMKNENKNKRLNA